MFEFLSGRKGMFLVIIDFIIVILAYHLNIYFLGSIFEGKEYLYVAVFAAVVYILFMTLFRVYKQILRYSSAREYGICIFSCACSFLILCIASVLTKKYEIIKYHILAGIVISAVFVSVRVLIRYGLLASIRQIARRNSSSGKTERKRVLIIGAGAAGNLVINDIFKSYSDIYKVVGFIDDDKLKRGFTICGIKVLGGRERIVSVCNEKKVDLILLTIPSISDEEKNEIIKICNQTGKKLRILPGVNDLIQKNDMVKNLRDIEVTDLLSRKPTKLNNEEIKSYISNKVVMVTGGGGSIGSELARQIARFSPKELIILDIYENNAYDIEYEIKTKFPELNLSIIIASVRDKKRIDEIFEEKKPEIVFHAAAHKHVPLMEANSQEAIKNNPLGTLNVAEAADKYKAEKFVLISTDKAVNPTNVMGASKRMCELIIQGMNKKSKTEFAAVRFGNVLGSNGSVIPRFKKQIEEGGPITVTHKEITRFFMTIPEAAQLVLQAATFAKGGEIFVLDMGSPVKIYDLAVNMIKLSGLVPDRDIKIEVVGLRPGEKLYEELLMDEEGLKDTENNKIFIAKPMEVDIDSLKESLNELLRVAVEEDEEKLKKEILKIVPTYILPKK